MTVAAARTEQVTGPEALLQGAGGAVSSDDTVAALALHVQDDAHQRESRRGRRERGDHSHNSGSFVWSGWRELDEGVRLALLGG